MRELRYSPQTIEEEKSFTEVWRKNENRSKRDFNFLFEGSRIPMTQVSEAYQ